MLPGRPHVTEPLTGPGAFGATGGAAAQAQAAVLLLMGRQLHGVHEGAATRAREARTDEFVSATGLDDERAFPVPSLRPVERPLAAEATYERIRERYGYVRESSRDLWAQAYLDCAKDVYARPTHENAAALMQLCLDHPQVLVRVAAAFSGLPLTTDRARNIAILAAGLASQDSLEQDVAATALAQVAPEHPAFRALDGGETSPQAGEPARTIMLVHGTFARGAAWYQPGGDFHASIKGFRSDLYSAPDFFSWSGGYSDAARDGAADELIAWVHSHDARGLDLIGHSHGANVMMLATHKGMPVGKLVLLSCPVHADKYMPDFAKVGGPVHSVRVKLDLVILIDGGGQKFKHPNIAELVLPIWFDHSASHDPQVWKDHDIRSRIDL